MAGFPSSGRGPCSLLPIYISPARLASSTLLALPSYQHQELGGVRCAKASGSHDLKYTRGTFQQKSRERGKEGGEVTVSVSDQIKQRGMEEGFKSIRNNAQRCLQPCFLLDEQELGCIYAQKRSAAWLQVLKNHDDILNHIATLNHQMTNHLFTLFFYFVCERRGHKIRISASPKRKVTVTLLASIESRQFGASLNQTLMDGEVLWWQGYGNMTLNTVYLPSSGHNCPRQTLLIVCVWGGCGWRYAWEGRKRKMRLKKREEKEKHLKTLSITVCYLE